MRAQNTIGTQISQTIRGTIFAKDRKLNKQISRYHIITPQIIRLSENPRQLISHFIMT